MKEKSALLRLPQLVNHKRNEARQKQELFGHISCRLPVKVELPYACYCSEVTEDQVIEAVVKHGAKTVKEVNAITGAMKNSNCKENNPLGVCCHKIIQEAIDKGLAMK